MYDNSERPQRAVLISVDTGGYDAESSLEELKELMKSAGGETVAAVTQKRDKPDSATCIGSGRLLEIKEFAQNNDIDLLVFDCELTPTQIRNLKSETDIRTIDRTMLILDIFALHAKTNEGKLQVELAQLKYLMPRLTGKGREMSRLGGGIGTRGPGESKLETDRRHIRRRIETLKEELSHIADRRNQLRARRSKDGIITAAIVGYTNAGKSTLMNTLTQAGVLSEDKLFATLDPTSRSLKLPNGVSVMMIDTVGLVRRLPHHLVEAFKSTLEEAALADIIINVCDATSEEYQLHLDVTTSLLHDLGCENSPSITVFNKCDLLPAEDIPHNSGSVRISAKTGEGIDKLLEAVEENLPVQIKRFELLLPFQKANLTAQLRDMGALISEEYTADGILVSANVEKPRWHIFEPYEIKQK